jgi:hypothetical protein
MSGPLDRFARPCFEGFSGSDEKRERRSDFENSEDERRTRIGSLKRKHLVLLQNSNILLERRVVGERVMDVLALFQLRMLEMLKSFKLLMLFVSL